MLRAGALVAVATLALGACAAPQGRPDPFRGDALPGGERANVGAVVAAELGFARAAQEDGQWTAFAETATDKAVMFVPQPVNARTWLKGRANPPEAVRWQPHEVFASCDGSLAVTRGAWQQPDGSSGYFTTAWARQKDGEYRWVMDQGDTLAQPLAAPDFIASQVADCSASDGPARGKRRDAPLATIVAPACGDGGCRGGGQSADRTLSYEYAVAPDGARTVTVSLVKGGSGQVVLTSEVAAQ